MSPLDYYVKSHQFTRQCSAHVHLLPQEHGLPYQLHGRNESSRSLPVGMLEPEHQPGLRNLDVSEGQDQFHLALWEETLCYLRGKHRIVFLEPALAESWRCGAVRSDSRTAPSFPHPGDIVTHVYHARPEGVLDEAGQVRPSVRAAVERGVHFDVGHGMGSFSWNVARAGLSQGLVPGTISSDIHAWNVAGPVFDLATTASKLLHLGLSLPDVIRRVTVNPAACIGRTDEFGTLKPGATADLTLLRVAEGEFRFRDSAGFEEVGGARLDPVAVLREGVRYDCG